MYIIDPHELERAMAARGYPTLQALADAMGVHRNTIHHYLKGQSVFPKAVSDLLERLHLSPAQLIRKKVEPRHQAWQEIASMTDQLTREFPEVAWVLFGSRARGQERRYSDWDFGVFHHAGIDHRRYLQMKERVATVMEPTPYLADLTNICRADRDFLNATAPDFVFLGGAFAEWLALQERIHANEASQKI